MKLLLRAVTTILLCAGFAAPAGAQSLYGPGGLFLHPTAAVPPKGQLTPGILALPQHDSTGTWWYLSGSLDYGLTDDLEIGFTALGVTDLGLDPSYGGFFKYRLLRETASRPAVAIGYTQLGFGDVNHQSAFLALRKEWPLSREMRLVGHLGAMWWNESDGVQRDDVMPYAGIEWGITSRLSLLLEGRPRGNNELGTPLAITLAYQVTDQWRLAVSWANQGFSDAPKFGVGAGISLGSRR